MIEYIYFSPIFPFPIKFFPLPSFDNYIDSAIPVLENQFQERWVYTRDTNQINIDVIIVSPFFSKNMTDRFMDFYNSNFILERKKINFETGDFELYGDNRRRRRRFSTEEERRVARILKNRRTAEESRQRKIQKMKYLEELALNSGEKESKLRKELYDLGILNAFQSVELITFLNRLNL